MYAYVCVYICIYMYMCVYMYMCIFYYYLFTACPVTFSNTTCIM